MMINNPYGSHRPPLESQNLSRYDDRYWVALYNEGIGPEHDVDHNPNSPEAYLIGLEEKYKVEVTQFISVEPTPVQIMDYFKSLPFIDSVIAKTRFLLVTKSRTDFELILSDIYSETERAYNASMEDLLKKLAPKLVELRYETPEYNRLRKKLGLITISDLDSPVRGMQDILRRQARADLCRQFYR